MNRSWLIVSALGLCTGVLGSLFTNYVISRSNTLEHNRVPAASTSDLATVVAASDFESLRARRAEGEFAMRLGALESESSRRAAAATSVKPESSTEAAEAADPHLSREEEAQTRYEQDLAKQEQLIAEHNREPIDAKWAPGANTSFKQGFEVSSHPASSID